jgi:hypothetical protein
MHRSWDRGTRTCTHRKSMPETSRDVHARECSSLPLQQHARISSQRSFMRRQQATVAAARAARSSRDAGLRAPTTEPEIRASCSSRPAPSRGARARRRRRHTRTCPGLRLSFPARAHLLSRLRIDQQHFYTRVLYSSSRAQQYTPDYTRINLPCDATTHGGGRHRTQRALWLTSSQPTKNPNVRNHVLSFRCVEVSACI